jgi:hypothetical protein
MQHIKRLFFPVLVFLIVLLSCKNDKIDPDDIDLMKFREIAWNSLYPETQAIVLHSWQEAEAVFAENPDDGSDVIIVIFHTPNDALTCAISVYVDIESEEVIYPENRLLCD